MGAACRPDWPLPQLKDLPWDKICICNVEVWNVDAFLEQHGLVPRVLEELGLTGNATSSIASVIGVSHSRVHSLSFTMTRISWKYLYQHVTKLTTPKVTENCQGSEYLLLALEANPCLKTLVITMYPYLIRTNTWMSVCASPLPLLSLTRLELGGGWIFSLLEAIVVLNLRILSLTNSVASLDNALLHHNHGFTDLRQLAIDHCTVTPGSLIRLLKRQRGRRCSRLPFQAGRIPI